KPPLGVEHLVVRGKSTRGARTWGHYSDRLLESLKPKGVPMSQFSSRCAPAVAETRAALGRREAAARGVLRYVEGRRRPRTTRGRRGSRAAGPRRAGRDGKCDGYRSRRQALTRPVACVGIARVMTVDAAQERTGAGPSGRALRPDALGTHHAVAAGHPLAALAAFRILEAGGNAVDAGVAGGICLGVVHPDIVNVAGVAPIIIYDAARREAVTVSGLGPWPRRATVDFFQGRCGGEIPHGILRTVMPGAPDAWITALERYGTLGFAEVAAP